MGAVTYKCPNCDGGLIFNPKTQKFHCEYCMSSFSEEELRREDSGIEKEAQQETKEEDQDVHMALYTCPSCGAEVVADETTTATFCYYCHNPIVLSARLEGEFQPDKVIPFTLDQKAATEKFLEWVGKRKFVPKAFFSKKQIEKISGIYFPYWVADCNVDAQMSANGTKVRVWCTGDIEYTETQHFRVEREGQVLFDGITKQALRKETEAWVENVRPFKLNEMKDFHEAYLLGFQAEKRNVERKDVEQEVLNEAEQNAKAMIKNSAVGYQSLQPHSLNANVKDTTWKYTLFPVWILTYRNKGDKVYYYAMNGQTGKISGQLPIHQKKLWIMSACITLGTALTMMIGALI